jgi:hypothetical protein
MGENVNYLLFFVFGVFHDLESREGGQQEKIFLKSEANEKKKENESAKRQKRKKRRQFEPLSSLLWVWWCLPA